MTATGMLRLTGEGVTHAVRHGAIATSNVSQATACGIHFVGFEIPNESPQSSLRLWFRTIAPLETVRLLHGTDLPVDCMTCLVRMGAWDQRSA